MLLEYRRVSLWQAFVNEKLPDSLNCMQNYVNFGLEILFNVLH